MARIKWIREADSPSPLRFGVRNDAVLYTIRWNSISEDYQVHMHHPGTIEKAAPSVYVRSAVDLEKAKEAAELHFEDVMRRLGLKDADG